MNRITMIGTAMCSCAIALTGCTQPGASDAVVVVAYATIAETMERDEHENGQFRLTKFCELGLKMLDNSVDPCTVAHDAAYQRGDFALAKELAALACSRDKDEVQCRNASAVVSRVAGA